MKKITIILFVFVFQFAACQTTEQQIAIKACKCLETKVDKTEDEIRNCVSTAMAEVILASTDTKVRESINTVEGMQDLLKNVYAILPKYCLSAKSSQLQLKEDQFYSNSKIENAQGSYIIGKDFMRAGKYAFATESFNMAIKADPKFVLAYDDLAFSYRKIDDYKNAIKNYKKSLEIFPEGKFALTNIGVAYSLNNDYKNAVVYYEKYMQYYPNDAEGYYGAGKAQLMQNELEKALHNIFLAYKIYFHEKSDYLKDAEQLLQIIHGKLEDENREDVFIKIAKEHGINLE